MAMQASQFIGSKISLVTKAEIRYEGILYALDLQEATISLAKVKSFGTEDRPSDQPVHPKDEVFEFIIFRGADIKSLDVVEPPFMMHPPGGFRGGFRGGRGRNFFGRRNQHQPQGIIQAQQPAKVTFEEPFDFEKSHEELVQTLAKLEIVDKEKAAAAEAAAIQNGEASPPRDERENKEPAAEVVYYNKDDFFDNISCDGLKKQKPGKNVRIDRRAEHKLNSETFGESAARGGQRRGGYGGSYFYRNNYYRGNPNPYYSMMGGYDPTGYFMPGNGGYGNYRRGGGGGGGRGRGFYSGGFYDNF